MPCCSPCTVSRTASLAVLFSAVSKQFCQTVSQCSQQAVQSVSAVSKQLSQSVSQSVQSASSSVSQCSQQAVQSVSQSVQSARRSVSHSVQSASSSVSQSASSSVQSVSQSVIPPSRHTTVTAVCPRLVSPKLIKKFELHFILGGVVVGGSKSNCTKDG